MFLKKVLLLFLGTMKLHALPSVTQNQSIRRWNIVSDKSSIFSLIVHMIIEVFRLYFSFHHFLRRSAVYLATSFSVSLKRFPAFRINSELPLTLISGISQNYNLVIFVRAVSLIKYGRLLYQFTRLTFPVGIF